MGEIRESGPWKAVFGISECKNDAGSYCFVIIINNNTSAWQENFHSFLSCSWHSLIPYANPLAQAGQVLGSLSVNLTASDACGGSGEPALHPKCSPASRAPAVHQGLP